MIQERLDVCLRYCDSVQFSHPNIGIFESGEKSTKSSGVSLEMRKIFSAAKNPEDSSGQRFPRTQCERSVSINLARREWKKFETITREKEEGGDIPLDLAIWISINEEQPSTGTEGRETGSYRRKEKYGAEKKIDGVWGRDCENLGSNPDRFRFAFVSFRSQNSNFSNLSDTINRLRISLYWRDRRSTVENRRNLGRWRSDTSFGIINCSMEGF